MDVGGAQPRSVISEATYELVGSEDQQVLRCEVGIVERLRAGWASSPLLMPGFLDISSRSLERARAEAELARYPDGFVVERMEFSQFTNVMNLRFPTLATFKAYHPGIDGPYHEATLRLSSIAEEPGRAVVFPVLRPLGEFSIAEARLYDRSLGIGSVRYRTNELSSLAIAPAARVQFERAVELARNERRLTRIRNMIAWALIAILAATPVFLLCYYRRSQESTS
jgi:hypothetical protein